MRVELDNNRCTGHGRCYSLTEELFVDDDAGYGRVLGDGSVPEGSEEAARRAAQACPEQAITIVE